MSTNPAEHRPAEVTDPEWSALDASPPHHRESAARRRPAAQYGGDDDLMGPSSAVYPYPPTKDDEPD
ncbi:hypothetical protein [Kitasatospora sp. DSM 101779]|uniref:hypothetical protein n=1 Tax=Kitasatospora sp. DSM 101779 TaxID=2853165 RepID=UPI0021D810EA|nr:hypothetical protein [Kitasatospora sp. DSM 101779]MCU7820583.1 hypothetical protein [Kitasatospora sp. DSM 101779]